MGNKPTGRSNKFIHTLTEVSHRLKELDIDSRGLQKVMEMLCLVIDAPGGALYRRHYSGKGSYHLVRICPAFERDESSSCFPETYSPEDLDLRTWNALNSNSQNLFDKLQFNDLSRENDVYIVPLFLDKKPYGLIIFSNPSMDYNKAELTDFLSAIGSLFELWIVKTSVTKQLEDVFDSIPNPAFIMASDDKIIYWNKANELMTGWRASQIIGKGNYESSLPYYNNRRPMVANLIMNPDDTWMSTYHEYEQEGDHVDALAFCPALPGGGGYLRTNTNRLYDINNRLWGAIHAVRDVTMERQLRENLHRSESLYRSISDFAGVGILLVSNEAVIYANEQAEEFLGKSSDSLTIDDLQNWVKLEGTETIQNLIKRLFKEKEKPLRFEFQAERDGRVSYFKALAQLMPHESKEVTHFVIDDISEQKKLDRRARMNELKLIHEERLTSLGIMAAGIAHELNQPLNTIRVVTDGFLFCNEKGWGMDRDEVVDNIEMISKQVSRMSTVIQNIRNFSREDQSEEFTDVSINKAIENVFSMIGRQLVTHNITVHKTLMNNIPTVMAPVNQLEQVVTNLLINARQAFEGCDHGQWYIWVETGVMDKTVFLKIDDNATGIPNELSKKIFYPFFTTKQVGKGTGLGLSICQTIVASMKGKLDAYNNKEGGATFVVNIPLQEMNNEYSGD